MPRVEQSGPAYEVDTRKATALLAYLAVTGEARSRDALANLLWPEYDTASARGALRRTLSSLRSGLAGAWLRTDRDTVDLDRAAVWTDVEHFRALDDSCRGHGHGAAEVCARCLPALREAASLYRDDFLAGFSLRDTFEFEDWQSLQADLLRRQLTSVLERLVRGEIARHEFEPAIGQARRWLAIDPLQESAHRALMQLYAWAGDRSAALRQYRECVRVLSEELDVSPLAETQELYAAIVEDRLAPPALDATQGSEASPPHRVVAQASLPFVGRSAELAVLTSAVEAIEDRGHLAVIEGEAGVGKSRLAEELALIAQARGAPVLQARCYEGEDLLAYSIFIDLLRSGLSGGASGLSHAGEVTRLEASRLLPELAGNGPAPKALDNPGALSRFFAGVCDLLAALAEGGVVVIEDLQWMDESSLDMLTYLARRLDGRPMLLLATWRSELVPAGHRLRQLQAESTRRGECSRVVLERLTPEQVDELVLSGVTSLPAAFRSSLYAETEGLPFFVVQFMHALHQGLLQPETAEWTLPEGAQELLLSRLAAISQQGMQLLTAAAVIGRSFSFETLREASGRGEEETLAAIEELLALGIIRELQGGDVAEFDFGHEKLRSLVYAQTSLARRRLLHRRVAEALAGERSRDKAGLAAKVAGHYRRAGEDTAAASYFRRAGEHAAGLHAHAEALSHYQAALALGGESASELHEAIGDLLVPAGDYRAAIASLERAAATAATDRLALVEQKLGRVYHRLGEWQMAERHFAASLEEMAPPSGAAAKARLLADWSLTAHGQGDGARATSLAQEALDLAEAADDEPALAQAHNILGILASSSGDTRAAEKHLERSLAIAEAMGDLGARIAALNNLALARRRAGAMAEATRLTRAALELVPQVGDRHREAALRNNLADLLQAQGESEAAMEHLKQAVAIFAEIGAAAGELQPEIWKLVEW